MDWEKEVRKLHKKELQSFKKEQLEKLETDYEYLRGQGFDNLHDWYQSENRAFSKRSVLIIVVAIVVIFLAYWLG